MTKAKSKPRSGVSLLEVMFAIGVVAVGLLGVIALLPVALSQVGRGNVSDRVLRLGQNAEEQFFTRNMFQSSLWVQPAARPPASAALTHASTAAPITFAGAYCIDPEFVVANVATTTVPSAAVKGQRTLDPGLFPYRQDPNAATSGNAYPLIERVSLLNVWAPAGTTVRNEILRQGFADSIFTLDDEVVFSVPEEKNNPPVQDFGNNSTRQSEGNFSWMATLAPVTTMSGTVQDNYFLSIVVMHRRDPTFSTAGSNESLVRIPEANFHVSGYRGGDVTLVASSVDELDVRPGQWIMLVRTWLGAPWIRWYRVRASDPTPDNSSGTWELAVTLDGPDWPVRITTAIPAQPETRAVIVRGVVEVFERTVHLE